MSWSCAPLQFRPHFLLLLQFTWQPSSAVHHPVQETLIKTIIFTLAVKSEWQSDATSRILPTQNASESLLQRPMGELHELQKCHRCYVVSQCPKAKFRDSTKATHSQLTTACIPFTADNLHQNKNSVFRYARTRET